MHPAVEATGIAPTPFPEVDGVLFLWPRVGVAVVYLCDNAGDCHGLVPSTGGLYGVQLEIFNDGLSRLGLDGGLKAITDRVLLITGIFF